MRRNTVLAFFALSLTLAAMPAWPQSTYTENDILMQIGYAFADDHGVDLGMTSNIYSNSPIGFSLSVNAFMLFSGSFALALPIQGGISFPLSYASPSNFVDFFVKGGYDPLFMSPCASAELGFFGGNGGLYLSAGFDRTFFFRAGFYQCISSGD